ncbi:hypothetical protein FNV43_RR25543 [Rhamnella rubrinervis]|uniref:Nudix hydrolase domain-containing protein n=1 Tax=Rhamnella rubrinervis TaxID=2594499 RepID=A0A8K0GU95_9ROSA|nr:hypothetical protein FNV43_RR25543 [Rhamnella rubrinervis]
MEAAPQGYRRNVGICLINDSKKIFAASRLDIPSAWQMLQGGIDEGEDPRNAAIRELREETGVNSAEIIAEVPYWLTYDFPPAVREKLRHQWGSDWKGQAQKWFLVKFTGKDEEIDLLGDGTEKAEFGDWSWMSADQIVDLAVDFKKPVYKEAVAKFYGVTSTNNCSSDSELVLFKCDLYGDKDPSQIWSEHGGLKLNLGEELYLFTKLMKLSINGSRFNRHIPSGMWSGERFSRQRYCLVDGGADPTVVCRLRREVKGQKRKLTNFIPTHPYFCSSLSSPSVGDHHHRQQRIKKQRVGGNLHADAADDVIDFGFLFESDDEQDLKEITREEYIKKAAAVNVSTENFVEIDDDDDHGINNVAKSSSTSTTGGQDRGDQIILSEDANDALLKLIFEITDGDEELEKILPINYSDEQDLNEVTREEHTNNAAVTVSKTLSSTTHHHHHQVDVVEEYNSYGGTENFVEIDDDDDGISKHDNLGFTYIMGLNMQPSFLV